MAKDKTTLRFWLRTDRPNKDGSSPVHLIYQIQGQRKYFAVPGIRLFSINWDPKKQAAIYLDRKAAKKVDPLFDPDKLLPASDVNEINSKLKGAADDIRDIETRFRLDKISFSVEMVIRTLTELKKPETKKEAPAINVVDFIKQFVKDSAATHKLGTLKIYSGLAAHLAEFEKHKKRKLTFDSIDTATLRAIGGYLSEAKKRKTVKGKVIESSMNNVTAAKQMSTLKTLLNYARTIYKIEVNADYRDFKITRNDSEFEVITVTQDEFNDLYNLDLTESKKLDPIRDVFCFACATGLRYSDLQQLRWEHIRKDHTIRLTASKTGQKLVIPLNPFSFSILEKYKDRAHPLPIISNQKTNEYIKELGKKAKINSPIEIVRMYGVKKKVEVFKKYQLLSIHVGRKSFITLSLEKGIGIAETMKLSGHTTFKAFSRYVDVNDNRKKAVMAEAWGKIDDNKLKAI